jgi:hypothetical protein
MGGPHRPGDVSLPRRDQTTPLAPRRGDQLEIARFLDRLGDVDQAGAVVCARAELLGAGGEVC